MAVVIISVFASTKGFIVVTSAVVALSAAAVSGTLCVSKFDSPTAVSYTHLTLPTMAVV